MGDAPIHDLCCLPSQGKNFPRQPERGFNNGFFLGSGGGGAGGGAGQLGPVLIYYFQ